MTNGTALRRGWTTGACAAAATKAAFAALATGRFPDPVTITLPRGQKVAFALAFERAGENSAEAGIIKDAGDDPDVTHGVCVCARVAWGPPGLHLVGGEGIGTVTRAGLPLAVGEPAINPVPRKMITKAVAEIAQAHAVAADIEVTLSIPGGAEIAKRTWNPRLGIVGGLSILGTTGIVRPFSCSAWIHSIHRGIDVARAAGLRHVLGATGAVSEKTARDFYGLPEIALLDMGDFAGGLMKYLRTHPIDRLTLAGGFAKMSKLANGALDLHSGRSQVDLAFLAGFTDAPLSEKIEAANTALEALEMAREAGIDLAAPVAASAARAAQNVLREAPVSVDVMVVDRQGNILARAS